MKVIVSKNIPQ